MAAKVAVLFIVGPLAWAAARETTRRQHLHHGRIGGWHTVALTAGAAGTLGTPMLATNVAWVNVTSQASSTTPAWVLVAGAVVGAVLLVGVDRLVRHGHCGQMLLPAAIAGDHTRPRLDRTADRPVNDGR